MALFIIFTIMGRNYPARSLLNRRVSKNRLTRNDTYNEEFKLKSIIFLHVSKWMVFDKYG